MRTNLVLKRRGGRGPAGLLHLALLSWLAWSAAPALALSITNVTAVNVTPTSFSVVWRANASVPSIAVFADPGGVTNLAGQVGVETYPLHTGNPGLAAGYDRRLGQQVTRAKSSSYGLAMVRVTGCRPSTTYYYQLASTPISGSPATYPTNGPLPSVTTPAENTFVINDQVLILEVPALDAEGRIVMLSNTNASYSLAAVVGDGANTNQAFLHLNDLFALAGGGNFGTLGQQEFNVDVLGANQTELLQKFTVNFTADFTVGQATTVTIGTEFLSVTVGSSVVRAGQVAGVPITANTSASVAGMDLLLDIPDGHLSGLTLQSLTPELDPATSSVISQGGTSWLVRLRARSGQSVSGAKQLAQLTGLAIAWQTSAFVPLRITGFTGIHSDSSSVKNLTAQSGRFVIVGAQPLLEPWSSPNGARNLTLYGIPGVPYGIQSTPALAGQTAWNDLNHFVATSLVTSFATGVATPLNAFFRALEFYPDPPVLDLVLLPDGSRQLTIYGQPGKDVAIEYVTSLGSPWQPLTQLTLTNGLAVLTLPPPSEPILFYRAVPATSAPGLPTLDLVLLPDGSRHFTVYGQPGQAVAIEYVAALGSPWQQLIQFTLTNTWTALTFPPPSQPIQFYRVVTVSSTPVPLNLELAMQADGSRQLTIQGQTGIGCTIETTTSLGLPWQQLMHFPMTNGQVAFNLPKAVQGTSFYRVVRFAPDPPVLEALSSLVGGPLLLTYGQTGLQYTLLASSTVSQPVTWTPVLNYTLTSNFQYLTPPAGGSNLFYRLKRN